MTAFPGFKQGNEYCRFQRITLHAALVSDAVFNGCSFSGCHFDETSFLNCKFTDCTFSDCSLNLCQFAGTTFSGVAFNNCQLMGINWSEASSTTSLLLKPLDFKSCVLNHGTMMGVNLACANLVDCTAHHVDFSEADMQKADCRGTDFTGSRFAATDLSGADFRGAVNYHISAQENRLKKTRFSLPEAMSLLYSLDIELDENL